MRRRTFSLSARPVDLTGKTAYLPTVMTHPSATVDVVTSPRKLAEGVASTGPLTRAIWLLGPVAEQSLLIDVQGKGVVMIVGCGHPLLSRLVARAQAVTGRPLYGVVGGLHFPVTGSRVGRGGQNILGNGKLPWQRIRRSEARDAAALLAGWTSAWSRCRGTTAATGVSARLERHWRSLSHRQGRRGDGRGLMDVVA